MAEELLACCGLSCTRCPAFLAERRSTPEARAKTASEWSTEAFPLTAADIDCHGCIGPDDQLIGFCRACDIRRCAVAREVATCADCRDYPCGKLDQAAPEARARFEALRSGR